MIKDLGNRLRMQRINNNLSRKQVADLVGVSVSMIGLYETGERVPSLPIIMKLSAQYKVSVDYLLGMNQASYQPISLDGLSEKQIKLVKQLIECFRELPQE